MMEEIRGFITDEDGMGTLEIVIIIAVLLSLALLFRKQISGLWTKASTGLTKHEQELQDLDLDHE